MKMFLAALETLRPRQWTKNFFVFPALIFSHTLFDSHRVLATLFACVVFCAISGCAYTLNDIIDRTRDIHHPIKSKRPIASGRLPVGSAFTMLIILTGASLTAALFLGRPFFGITLAYLMLQIAYSLVLKNQVILDVFALASGFVLRVVAGALAISVEISNWLLVCTILLALFLALSKRRHELTALSADATAHRKVLAEYSPHLLDQMISIVTASIFISYALYTMSDATIKKFGTSNLIFTVPFVMYGIFRYLYLIHKKNAGGAPEMTLLTDLPLLACVFGWGITAGLIVYVR